MRLARCDCGVTLPSDSANRAFFQTAESIAANRCAVCSYAPRAHDVGVREQPHMARWMGDGHAFTPAPIGQFDSFYCGCRGWD